MAEFKIPIEISDETMQRIAEVVVAEMRKDPDADWVEVVRCKDCKWWDKVDNIDGVSYGTCERKCTAIRQDAFPNENWFCKDGKRKENRNEE